MLVKRFWIARGHPKLKRIRNNSLSRDCVYCGALGICDRLETVCGLFYYTCLMDLCQNRWYWREKCMFAYVEEVTENKENERISSIQV